MEVVFAALAGAGANSLAELLVGGLRKWAGKKFAKLLGHGDADREAAVGDEMERAGRELREALRSGDTDAAQDVEERLADHLQDFLDTHPDAAPQVRGLVASFIERSTPGAAYATVLHYVNHEATFLRMTAHWAACREANALTAFFLEGLPGIGKRTTARRWLHTHRDALTGERLHADLGPDGSGRPADLAAVLERWLGQLGVPRQDRPADVQAKADLVRRLTRGRPVVVLLENVTSAAQVKPLLPDSPGSVVVMSGQTVPPTLHTLLDFAPVHLDPLPDKDALDLLVKVSGSGEDPEKFRPLLPHLGGLPLALRLLAGHLREPAPGVLEELVDRLSDRDDRHALLHGDGDNPLFRALDLTYERLPEPAAGLYRRLGVAPRADLQLDTVYALAPDRDAVTVRRALYALRAAGLVERRGGDTYLVHPLVHDHASSLAERTDPEEQRAAVRGRFVAYYLNIAEAGEAALSARFRYDPMGAYVADARAAAGRAADAERELARRRDGLVAAVRLAADTGRHMDAWRLCQGLWTYQLRTGSHAEWIETRRLGMTSARACGDRLAEARMEYELGFAHMDRWSTHEDDPRHARTHLERALTLVHRRRDEAEQRTASSALEALGLMALKEGRPQRALDLLDDAVTALDGLAHPRGRALLAYHRARAYTALNRHNDATHTLADARARFSALPPGPDVDLNIAKCWLRHAEDRHACGQPAAALESLTLAVNGTQAAGAPYVQAEALLLRGDIQQELGAPTEAVADWTKAHELFESAGSPRTEEAQRRLNAMNARRS